METLTISPSTRGPGYVLDASIWVPTPRDEVFSFFSKAENLGTLTPESLGFRITTPLPIQMRKGALIDYRISLHGIPFGWTTLIREWQPPDRFIDAQLKGPYRHWVHEHRFTDQSGGTRIDDRVEYRALGGALVHRAFVRPRLEEIFSYRARVIRERFGGADETPQP
ncbi:MAG: SRPBCC family protein [Longimicrobiales bacterium]